jgi:NosR/NirI family nitrous oxide reductase transcriptional regulator
MAPRTLLLAIAALLAALLGALPPARAAGRLAEFLPQLRPADLVPGADRFGPVEGDPPTAAVLAGDRLLGYAYLTADVVNAVGYSGKPIVIAVGLSLDGRIAGARLLEHHEPIVLVGIPIAKVTRYIDGFVGRSGLELAAAAEKGPPVDLVSGATVTMMVIGDSLTRSAIKVARARGLGGAQPAAAAVPQAVRTIDLSPGGGNEDWAALLGDDSVRRLHLSVGEVSRAFAQAGNQAAVDHPESANPDDTVIDLYVALASVPAIGRSLLGPAEYAQLAQRLQPGQQAILVAGSGLYSFKGSGYVRGGIFDRIAVLQGENSLRFRDRDHKRLADLAAAGAPDLPEIALFTIPAGAPFQPTEPWRLQLLVQRPVGGRDKAFLTFELGYTVPDKYVHVEQRAVVAAVPAPAAAPTVAAPTVAAPGATTPTAAPTAAAAPEEAAPPLWQRMWWARSVDIAILLGALALLSAIFFFQDLLVRRPVLYDRLRLAFLAFTLLWIGWYAQAQLSVVNVLTFTGALRSDFSWDYFLMDPLIFILWFAVAASILFWNRGAFCGWLCPFGALQELTNRLARLLHVPQLKIPFAVHQRLWVIKYIGFLILFGLSLNSLAAAERASEVEPFKTAIVLHFLRDWPFVLYAVLLIVAGLFVERFFCRYLCPLGAALAIPARLRMFDWLRRYKECGSPCQRCGNECPVQSIHPEGHINPNECIQCLHCQMLYHHDHRCPVMIQRRLKREKRLAASSPSLRPPVPAKPRAAAARESLTS